MRSKTSRDLGTAESMIQGCAKYEKNCTIFCTNVVSEVILRSKHMHYRELGSPKKELIAAVIC